MVRIRSSIWTTVNFNADNDYHQNESSYDLRLMVLDLIPFQISCLMMIGLFNRRISVYRARAKNSLIRRQRSDSGER